VVIVLTVITLGRLCEDLHLALSEAKVSTFHFEFSQDVRMDLNNPVYHLMISVTQFEERFDFGNISGYLVTFEEPVYIF